MTDITYANVILAMICSGFIVFFGWWVLDMIRGIAEHDDDFY